MAVIIKENPEAVAKTFADAMVEKIRIKDRFTIALSGGSTPKLLFKLLSNDYNGLIDWNKVHFFWGDERCVPPDHEESNFLMTKQRLFDHISIPESNIHRVKGENDPQHEAERYEMEIRDHFQNSEHFPSFDLLMLGMGTDGHTASIFPNQMELLESEKICEVAVHPDSGQKRVTLTGPVLNQAAEVDFLVTGASKAEKVREILKEEGKYKSYPAYHIKPSNGLILWYLDTKAAKDL